MAGTAESVRDSGAKDTRCARRARVGCQLEATSSTKHTMPAIFQTAICLLLALCAITASTQTQDDSRYDPAPVLRPYEPPFLRTATPAAIETASTASEQQRRAQEEQHAKLTDHQRVCVVLLKPFSAHARLDRSIQVAAELLLNYHKAGLSCFVSAEK